MGESTGFEHWQLIAAFSTKVALGTVRRELSPHGHYEPTRSDAARAYCFKETTRIEGSGFELGQYPMRRNHGTDWVINT